MNLSFLLGMFFGMIAALMLNLGKGVQKQKVHVFKQGRKMFVKPHRADLGVWLIGLSMTAGASVPFALGLKFSGSPSMISAMTGIGLIGLAIYAVKVINEKLSKADTTGIILVVFATSSMAYLNADKKIAERFFSDVHLLLIVLSMVAVAAAFCVSALRFRRIHGVAFGSTAGMFIGLSLFLGDATLIRVDDGISRLALTIYIVGLVIFSVGATAVTQLGFLRARAIEVVPATNSALILTPLLLEILIYRDFPSPLFFPFLAIILFAVFLLSRGAAAKVAA